MFTLFSDRAPSIADLAATLTDPALELLSSAGARGDSVETELELWRALTAELRRQPVDPPVTSRPDAPLDRSLKRVVNRAALRSWRGTARMAVRRPCIQPRSSTPAPNRV